MPMLMEASDKPKQSSSFPDEEVSVRLPAKAGLSHGELMGTDPEEQDRQRMGTAGKEVSLLLPAAAEQRHAKAAGTQLKRSFQEARKSSVEDISKAMPATTGVQSRTKAGHGPAERQQQPKGVASQIVSLLMPEGAGESTVTARGKQPKKPAARAALIGEDAGRRTAAQAKQKPESKGRTQQTALGAMKANGEESADAAIAKWDTLPEVTMASGWGRQGAPVLPKLPKAGKAAEQVALQQLKQAEQPSFGQASAVDVHVAVKADEKEAHPAEQGSSWLSALRAAKQQEQAGTNPGNGVFELLTHDWGQDVTDNTREINQVH